MAHDYGLKREVCEYTSYGPIWVEKPHKKVILVNTGECKDKITVSHVTNCLQGMGWAEWEELLAYWLVEVIVEAIDNGQEETNISKLFACELHGSDHFGPFCRSQERVACFLMGRLFECIEENDEVMRVRIIERAIC